MALLAVDRCRSLIDQKGYQRLVRQVCDLWSQTQRKQQAWQPALDVYTRGLKRLPGDRHLVTNATATWHQWAAIYIKQKQWEKAIEIYQQALKQFPRDRKLQNNLKFCQQQQDQSDCPVSRRVLECRVACLEHNGVVLGYRMCRGES